MVSAGGNINARDIYGCTPLHFAAMRGNEVATKELLSCKGINIEVLVDGTKLSNETYQTHSVDLKHLFLLPHILPPQQRFISFSMRNCVLKLSRGYSIEVDLLRQFRISNNAFCSSLNVCSPKCAKGQNLTHMWIALAKELCTTKIPSSVSVMLAGCRQAANDGPPHGGLP